MAILHNQMVIFVNFPEIPMENHGNIRWTTYMNHNIIFNRPWFDDEILDIG
jgi:hypothetical protein